MTIATGSVLAERWELTSRLASGGMGDVYQAQDRRGGSDVAIKVLRSGIVQGEERFAGEIEMLRRLDHPHVVSVVDAGEQEGMPYLVMELLPGRSLSDLLRDGALDLERVRRIGAAIAAALAYAHGHGIVNRDLKPGNILFDEDGTAKLADFGIAKLMDVSGITITGQALGTASYIAPEQLSAPDQVGPATDVYSLGLVLLEAVSGKRAFVGSGTEAAMARLARDPEMPSDLPDPWRLLLRAMTARNPDLRPAAVAVAELLDGDVSEEAVQTLAAPAARVGEATRPMALPPAIGSSAPTPVRDETQVMGEATHAMAASGTAGVTSDAGTPPRGADASDAAPTAVSRPARSSPPPRRRRNAAPWILVILLLLVVAAGAVFLVLDLGGDAADEPEPEAPAETEDPPEEEVPDDTDPDEPAEVEEPPEEPEPEPQEPEPEPQEPEPEPQEPEPEPEESAEESGPPDEDPSGGPPDDTPGDT